MLSRKEINRIITMSHGYHTIKTLVLKTGHSKNTIKKHLINPHPMRIDRNWRTRQNPFESVWNEIAEMIHIHPALEAKTIFEYLQNKYPGKFDTGQLRTLQRHLRSFKAHEGPGKEVIFEQLHRPGQLCASDFTHMGALNITICGQPFEHLLYHFVLTYSNWEWARISSSESLESLRSGLKEALLRLGGVPEEHLSDRLSAAVHNLGQKGEFKQRYQDLMDAFKLKARATQPNSPHENGDVEQRHYRLKKAIDQELMLRSSRDFASVSEYEQFLHKLLIKLNSTRIKRIEEEIPCLKPLPEKVIADFTIQQVKVSRYSTIRIQKCCYSVPSNLISETVNARVYDNKIEIFYGQKKILECPRIRGESKHYINYRHIVETLRRKPGAFANYRYHDSLFPSTTYRMTYDALKQLNPRLADKHYIEILHMAATNGEEVVERCLKLLFRNDGVSLENLQTMLQQDLNRLPKVEDVFIPLPDLKVYDNAFGLEVNA